ncbi:hypothetical protein FRZ44_42360 [Hypericibacter terrae]|uniref:Uncharacterized protein n=1 Tax=Hypericibacter terrae TaxID=2602015 RepID=A0A5J6MQL8_9PROT|nr:hypothetical protein [Hypericibacter terrae]QEX18925.1 hypothetical protein FRZ44_42360 [Hypericibacter terrae]
MTDEVRTQADHKREMMIRQERTEHDWRLYEAKIAMYVAHNTAIIDFAGMAIKGIILANSAAAGAVLIFVGPFWGKPGYEKLTEGALAGVSTFAQGILAAIICAMLSYITQQFYSGADMRDGDTLKKRFRWVGGFFHVLALIAAVAGVLSFAVGACDGLRALEATRLFQPAP